MFESKYSKVLTVILVIVIIAIVALLGFLAYDYIKKYNTTKQASDFVENYQGDINSGNQNNEAEETGNVVKSPMVGTFYTKPSPTSNPYVEIGKDVKKGDTLCIIEAMKLMNEIYAETDGTITEVCLNDGDVAEYAQVLFRMN